MKQAGGIVKFTVYPEAGHDSWNESYANPELYDWLLQQKRAK
jgi:predicted peptidase